MTASQTKDRHPPSALAIRSSDLLALGKPFVEFPEYSILELKRHIETVDGPDVLAQPNGQRGRSTGAVTDAFASFSHWFSTALQAGKPFVIRDFEKLSEWDNRLFSIEGLIELSTKKNIPIRNCGTGRDLSFTLKKFADAAGQSHREFKNLYARDLQCPEAWLQQCRTVLPQEVQWSGRQDLFQWLPSCARSEVMMAYVGSEGSSSGFHRCFSSTVALNLLVEGGEQPVLCFGTDFESQAKYDSFMAARGASPHVDWLNLGPEELKKADFPIYVHDQKPGDLVVFPPATAHQVWNLGSIATKMVWNILHPLSLEAGLNYVQPPFNRLCHPDVARSNLSLACAMLSLLRDPKIIPPDLALLTRLFRQLVQDETINERPATPVSLVSIPETAIATCNFCGTAIWNRHLQCNECQDFDLCLLCFLSGRSCEHISSYSWVEIVPQETCTRVLQRAEAILGYKPADKRDPDRQKSLGSTVNDLMHAKQCTSTKLCHLCRIDHLEWKGRRCNSCSAFFCYRGLYRHFDMSSADVMRHTGLWTCPKCLEACNCRCCHFSTAYVKAEKPASKRRVKPGDPRGKVMGFTDNVFDQKRRTPPRHTTPARGSTTSPKVPKRSLPPSTNTPDFSRSIPSHSRAGSPSNLNLLTPESELSLGSQGNTAHRQTKTPRTLSNGDVTANQRQKALKKPSDKMLHGIDYITHMPSPAADRLSLPPLKPGNIGKASGPLPPSSTPEPSQTIPHESPVVLPHLTSTTGLKRNHSNPTPNGIPKANTEIKHDTSPGNPSPIVPTATNPTAEPLPTPQSQSLTNHPPRAPSTLSTSTSTTQTSVSKLESQLTRLRHYADELLSLSLHDSHRILQQEIQRHEDELLLAKRERSERLMRGMETEFPELVGVKETVRREGAKLGYFQ